MKEFAGKRVLIMVENLAVPFDRRVWLEARALAERGAEVAVICPTQRGFRKRRETIDGIRIYRHPLFQARGAAGYAVEYALALLWEILLARRIFLRHGFHAIHLCNPPDLLYLAAAPYRRRGVEIVFDHHDLNPELYLAKFGRKDVFYALLRFFERRTFRAARVCIATNESYRRIALTRGGKNPGDVFVVRSGPDTERMRSVPPLPALKKGGRILVGFVGVIGKQEGLSYLVDAARLLRDKKRGDIRFIVVGDGPHLKDIQNYARKKAVDQSFTFTGRVSDPSLLAALATADICVNPDEYNEMNDQSTMNKVLEYMALKKPIVQFDLTEGRISAGDASLYAKRNDATDLAEKILVLADDPEKRKAMGDIGYRRIQTTLSWEHQKEFLFAAYRRLWGRNGSH